MIKINNLSKTFTKKTVLHNLNLEIKDGSIFGLIGINGAGKSTLLRLLSGVLKADSGEILFDGINIFDNVIFQHCWQIIMLFTYNCPIIINQFIVDSDIRIKCSS